MSSNRPHDCQVTIHRNMALLTSSVWNRVIFVALTNILLITALVSLVSNSLTEVCDICEQHTSMILRFKVGRSSVTLIASLASPSQPKNAPALVAIVSDFSDRLTLPRSWHMREKSTSFNTPSTSWVSCDALRKERKELTDRA